MGSDKKSNRPQKAPPLPPIRVTKAAEIKPAPLRSGRPLVRTAPSEALVTTARRAPVRVLVRAGSHGPLGPSLDGDAVIPVGAAARETWGELWEPGDEEAIVWVLVSRVNERMVEIRQNPRIVDVLVSMRDVK